MGYSSVLSQMSRVVVFTRSLGLMMRINMRRIRSPVDNRSSVVAEFLVKIYLCRRVDCIIKSIYLF